MSSKVFANIRSLCCLAHTRVSVTEIVPQRYVVVFMRQLQPKIPIPYTVVLMLLGIFYGILSATVHKPLSDYTSITHLDPHWLLQIFLPVLLFESSFTVDIRIFRKAVGHILVLATCGLGKK